ncbi:MAG: DNA polymerase IV [Dehalococcoidales bacterium]|nr:DNA polymerase IV [Dehalococcoidales bacterium]
MPLKTVMHIDLDAFFVSVEQVLNPALKGKPVVVGGSTDRRGVVATASYEARAFGVHSGMPMATALRLCPQAIFLTGNYHRYAEASRRFMGILADFSPFLEPMGLDEAFLEVTGFESLHKSIYEMAQKIRARVRAELGLAASIGIAPCKIVAKVASDEAKPDGLMQVLPGGEAAFLAPLAIRKLPGVGEKTEAILKGLGIKTIGILARMPETALKHRFGMYGETLHRHANGIDHSHVLPPAEAKSTSRETTFERDTRDMVFLSGMLRYLAEKVGADLRRYGRQTACVAIKVRFADFTTLTRQCTLANPTDADQYIFQTGDSLLKKTVQADKRAVRLIGIGVSIINEPGRQLPLLNGMEQRWEKLNRVIDKMRVKYGFSVIQSGQTLQLRKAYHSGSSDFTHPPLQIS